jgi:hypothetical protein
MFLMWKVEQFWLDSLRPKEIFFKAEMKILLIAMTVFGMAAVYEPNSIIPKYFHRQDTAERIPRLR